ncbi:hypothetical protein [Faecalibacillus intestinalis]|uniref:hypothetical protein n=1 Tax=Faecalibacillus intestinalis TaxID=1982626 RepID=UPI003992AA08
MNNINLTYYFEKEGYLQDMLKILKKKIMTGCVVVSYQSNKIKEYTYEDGKDTYSKEILRKIKGQKKWLVVIIKRVYLYLF